MSGDAFKKVIDDDAVLSMWRRDRDKGGQVWGRKGRIADHFGVSDKTVQRALVRLKLTGEQRSNATLDGLASGARPPSREKARQIIQQSPAARIAADVMAAGAATGIAMRDAVAGLVLADVLTGQRAEVQRASSTVSLLSEQLAAFVAPFVEPDVTGLHQVMHEDQLGKAVAIADKLVTTMARVHEMQRESWGITKDSLNPTHSDVMAQLTAEMERRRQHQTPPPVEHPPGSENMENQKDD